MTLLLTICVLLFSFTSHAELQKISEHVYAYVQPDNASPSDGADANAGLVVGTDAALVIDTLTSAKAAQRFLADIRKVTDKPIKYAVNTHFHFDHAWGNCEFATQGAEIVGSEKAQSNDAVSKEWFANPGQFGITSEQLEGTTLAAPTKTFADKLTLDLGGVTVELVYHGPTHTNDSITAFIPEDNVLFTGDLLFSKCHPFLAQGDIENWQKVLNSQAETTTATIIPGHGPLSAKQDLLDMSAYIKAFDPLARELCSGKKPEDALAIAQELIPRLPDQQRSMESFMMVVMNLQMRYLQQPVTEK